MYEIIGTRASRALRVLWMAEELGLTYTHIPAKPRDDALENPPRDPAGFRARDL